MRFKKGDRVIGHDGGERYIRGIIYEINDILKDNPLYYIRPLENYLDNKQVMRNDLMTHWEKDIVLDHQWYRDQQLNEILK